MDRFLQDLVFKRAGSVCEYCRHPAPPFHVEHIIARKHGGPTHAENLALACIRCNFHKGPNISGIDPETSRIVRLFHPRNDVWAEHFRWENATLLGITPEGRATIAVLEINHPLRVEVRRHLANEHR
jgi:5-methylcytosine-specific restriction endonuclease McrA